MIRLSNIKRGFATTDKLIFTYKNSNCKITFNNEKNLNALDLEMIKGFKHEIDNWRKTNNFPKILILTSSPESKAFCAGGDVKAIYNLRANKSPPEALEEYFKEEYELDYLVSQLEKHGTTTISMWKGIVMGGGVGISINSTFKIACENTMFAMPEALIGLFTDVAAVYHLNRLPKELARAIGLGGMRLKGAEMYLSGLANRYVQRSQMEEIEAKLLDLTIDDPKKRHHIVSDVLDEKLDKQSIQKKLDSWAARNEHLKQAFSGNSFEEMMHNFEPMKDHPDIAELSNNIVKSSPLSLKVIYNYLNRSKGQNLRQTYLSDFRLIKHFMRTDEFFIGVKNLLIDKSKERPKWTYATSADVPDEVVDRFLSENIHESKPGLVLD
jgi:enoyl-CoA hydratase/carnithine racemase